MGTLTPIMNRPISRWVSTSPDRSTFSRVVEKYEKALIDWLMIASTFVRESL